MAKNIRDVEDTHLLVVGRIEDKKLLKKIYEELNCKYIGFLDHTQLLDLELTSDPIIALYDSNLQRSTSMEWRIKF